MNGTTIIIIDPLTSHSGPAHGELPSLFLSAVLFFFSYLVFLASWNPDDAEVVLGSDVIDLIYNHVHLNGLTCISPTRS